MTEGLNKGDKFDKIIFRCFFNLLRILLFHAIERVGDLGMGIPNQVLAFPHEGIDFEPGHQVALRPGNLAAGVLSREAMDAAEIHHRPVHNLRTLQKNPLIRHLHQLEKGHKSIENPLIRGSPDAGHIFMNEKGISILVLGKSQVEIIANTAQIMIQRDSADDDQFHGGFTAGEFIPIDCRFKGIKGFKILEEEIHALSHAGTRILAEIYHCSGGHWKKGVQVLNPARGGYDTILFISGDLGILESDKGEILCSERAFRRVFRFAWENES